MDAIRLVSTWLPWKAAADLAPAKQGAFGERGADKECRSEDYV